MLRVVILKRISLIVLTCVLGVNALCATTLKSVIRSSWYGKAFHGRTMANGKPFNMYAMTAAHKTLPFGTCLLVKNKDAKVVVEVTDRGPFIEGRDLDLSYAAADQLGIIGKGTGLVIIEIIGRGNCEQKQRSSTSE